MATDPKGIPKAIISAKCYDPTANPTQSIESHCGIPPKTNIGH